jgi:hypothetical protein
VTSPYFGWLTVIFGGGKCLHSKGHTEPLWQLVRIKGSIDGPGLLGYFCPAQVFLI